MSKQKTKTKFKISYLKVGLFLVFAYFLGTVITQQLKLDEYNIKREYYLTQIQEKQEQTEYYKDLADKVSTEEYMEKLAREELGLVKPYEKIFIDVNN